MEIDQAALGILKGKVSLTVQELYDQIRVDNELFTKSEMIYLIERLVEREEVRIEDITVSESFTQYLKKWESNCWLYFSFAASFGTILTMVFSQYESSLVTARWTLGSIFVLFVPGYVAGHALFPRDEDISSFGRFLLSLGLSLVLVMLIGLILNYLSFGVRLLPIVTLVSIFIVMFSVIAVIRKYRVSQP